MARKSAVQVEGVPPGKRTKVQPPELFAKVIANLFKLLLPSMKYWVLTIEALMNVLLDGGSYFLHNIIGMGNEAYWH